MELSTIIPHIETLIFASEKPLTNLDIVELINNAFAFMDERITLDQVEAAVEGIREKYNAEFYPFEVRESGGGWQFLTKKEFHKTVGQLNGDKFLKRLSNAALETLAIIAYKQPITKGEVESIRGVNSDYSIQKLLEKELIIITGRNEELPGKPLVYATSKSFMDYFGLNTVDDLPKINEVLAEQTIEGTIINDALKRNEAIGMEDDNSSFTVTDSGELVTYKLQPDAVAGQQEEANTTEAVNQQQSDPGETNDSAAQKKNNTDELADTGEKEPAAFITLASELEEFSDADDFEEKPSEVETHEEETPKEELPGEDKPGNDSEQDKEDSREGTT